MTGLGGEGGPGRDTLLEVAVLITDADLNVVAEGPQLVIHHPEEELSRMNDWCKEQFGYRGPGDVEPGKLAEQALKSTITVEEADAQLTTFVQKHVWKHRGVLAGNTVHMDKRFLDKFCPNFMGHLHYRIVDVSTVKELCRRWYPGHFAAATDGNPTHRAMEDIRGSLNELKYYRSNICIPQGDSGAVSDLFLGRSSLKEFLSESGNDADRKDDLVRELFGSFFDEDGNQVTSTAELGHFMKDACRKLTDEVIDGMVKEADVDDDGKITYADFVNMLRDKRSTFRQRVAGELPVRSTPQPELLAVAPYGSVAYAVPGLLALAMFMLAVIARRKFCDGFIPETKSEEISHVT